MTASLKVSEILYKNILIFKGKRAKKLLRCKKVFYEADRRDKS